jgi:hypothetical protein
LAASDAGEPRSQWCNDGQFEVLGVILPGSDVEAVL